MDIEPTAEIRKFMGDLENSGATLKMVDQDKIHITVKFLGDTEEGDIKEISETVRTILKKHEPFDLVIRGAGAFPHMDYMKVIWVGVENADRLEKIAHEIEEELVPMGFSRAEKSFSPHITLARVKGGKNKEELAQVVRRYRDTDFFKHKTTKLRLKESVLKPEGPEYKTLEEYFL